MAQAPTPFLSREPRLRSLTQGSRDVLPDDLIRGMHEVLFNFEYYCSVQCHRHSWDQPSGDGGHDEQNDAQENDERDVSGVRYHVNYLPLRLQQR